MARYTTYYPEMQQAKPTAAIEAKVSHRGGYRLNTELELKGRGIKFEGKTDAGRIGRNLYYVTERAFGILCKAHTVTMECLLD